MDPLTLLIFVAFILLTTGFGLVFAKLIARDRISAPADSWEAILSPTRYQVMDRLLEEADQKMVEALGDPNLQNTFRKVRIKILRGYMQQLSQDFNSVAKAVKTMMVHSHADRRDLAGTLMRQQLLFAFGMMSLEFKLMLSELGFHTLGASGLTGSIDALRAQLQSLAAIAQPSAA
jgi:hypothetical protein